MINKISLDLPGGKTGMRRKTKRYETIYVSIMILLYQKFE
jgi:hypothetical protein